MAQTAAYLVDHIFPQVPVRQWVLSLPIALRVLLAAQPALITPVLQVVQNAVERLLLKQLGFTAAQAQGGGVTLIQRFGSAANLNIHLHCLVLDGVFRRTDSGCQFLEAPPLDEAAIARTLHAIVRRLLRLLVRRDLLVEDEGTPHLSEMADRRQASPAPVASRRHHLPHRLRPARRAQGAHAARGRAQR